MPTIASVNDFRTAAQGRLPRFLFDYADGGAFAEETCRRNVLDLQSLRLRQRVLRDVATIDLRTDILGRELPLPEGGTDGGTHFLVYVVFLVFSLLLMVVHPVERSRY